jgi:hypothetical protein
MRHPVVHIMEDTFEVKLKTNGDQILMECVVLKIGLVN